MGWSIGYDENWKRDIGYGVPAMCDHPGCTEEINRGLGCVCGSEPYGGDHGCGLFFCEKHLQMTEKSVVCARCADCADPFEPTPDLPKWIQWKLTDKSWQQWRDENPEAVAKLRASQA